MPSGATGCSASSTASITRRGTRRPTRTSPANYDADDRRRGQAGVQGRAAAAVSACRRSRDTPLLGMVARLVEQKGLDLIVEAGAGLLDAGRASWWSWARATRRTTSMLRAAAATATRTASGLTLGFDEPLAHQIEAGADLFLMPSLYEPPG